MSRDELVAALVRSDEPAEIRMLVVNFVAEWMETIETNPSREVGQDWLAQTWRTEMGGDPS